MALKILPGQSPAEAQQAVDPVQHLIGQGQMPGVQPVNSRTMLARLLMAGQNQPPPQNMFDGLGRGISHATQLAAMNQTAQQGRAQPSSLRPHTEVGSGPGGNAGLMSWLGL